MKSGTEFLDLACHAITLPGWRWMPGMLIADYGAGVRLCWMDDQHIHGVAADGCAWMRLHRDREHLPDLSDPATLGCLLALVREVHHGAYAEPNGAAEWDGRDEAERDHWWAVYAPSAGRIATGPTEAAALVAALGVSGG